MVATGLTGSYQIDEKNENVMQSFVYDDIDKGTTEDENNSEDDESLNVFTDNSNNNQTFSSDNDDEYDIPAFLRKK